MVDFLNFILKGKYDVNNLGLLHSLKFVIGGYFRNLFFYSLIVILFTYFGLTTSEKSPTVKHSEIPAYFKLLFVCLVMPLLEELVFRLPLRFNKVNIIIATILFFVLTYFLTKKYLVGFGNFRYFIFLFLSGISLLLLLKNYIFFESYFNKNFLLLMHLSTIIFCLIHYWNYNFQSNSITPYLLMFLMLINGYYFAYTRMKFGISYAIFIHSFHNIIVSIPLIVKFLK